MEENNKSWIDKIKECPNCHSKLISSITPNLIHYGRKDCPIHGFKGWLSNLDKEKKAIYRKDISIEQVLNFHSLNNEFCLFLMINNFCLILIPKVGTI